jgi:hypothetical protein
MNISPKLRDGLIVGGIAIVILFFLVPRKKGVKKVESNGAKADNLGNAKIVLDAFMNAVEAGENAQALNELNKEFVKEYKLKVFKNKQGKYVARTMDGKDVLMVK